MKIHVAAMVDFWNAGVPTLDYGNNIRQMALEEGLEDAFAFPGFVPAYIRPLFCRGVGPFRWVALSGDPEDIYKTDQKMKELFPENKDLHNWLDMARDRIAFQGLPARICWIGLGDRHRAGLAFNEMVANGELKAPIVIGRDHLDSGSVASPNRETEAMKDGSDAVSDWPLLNALVNTASGGDMGELASCGGVGMGFSQHSGVVICADGTPEAAKRLSGCCGTIRPPASGAMRMPATISRSIARANMGSNCPQFCNQKKEPTRETTMKNRFVKSTAMAVLLGLGLTAQAQADQLADIKAKGTITAATEMHYAPFDMLKDGEYQALAVISSTRLPKSLASRPSISTCRGHRSFRGLRLASSISSTPL